MKEKSLFVAYQSPEEGNPHQWSKKWNVRPRVWARASWPADCGHCRTAQIINRAAVQDPRGRPTVGRRSKSQRAIVVIRNWNLRQREWQHEHTERFKMPLTRRRDHELMSDRIKIHDSYIRSDPRVILQPSGASRAVTSKDVGAHDSDRLANRSLIGRLCTNPGRTVDRCPGVEILRAVNGEYHQRSQSRESETIDNVRNVHFLGGRRMKRDAEEWYS